MPSYFPNSKRYAKRYYPPPLSGKKIDLSLESRKIANIKTKEDLDMHGIINLLTPCIYTAHFLYNISQGGRK